MSTPVSTSPADDPTTSGARPAHGPRVVRLAVVQMDYHPDFRDALFDPLFDFEGKPSSLLPEGMGAAPEKVRQSFTDLRQRVRAVYVEQIRRRAEAIVEACKGWGVQLLVFPEYSIPPEVLAPLAKVAGDMVVVAGSHHVDRESLRKKRYEPLGVTEKLTLGEAVSPVLHGGKAKLVRKVHPARPEVGKLKPGTEWSPVELPASIPGPLGVLICLDFFNREGEQFRTLVSEALSTCRLVAAPALTNEHSRAELMAQARQDARRSELRRPVLIANIARYGGSTLVVDEGGGVDPNDFPEHAGVLEAKEEGVIVADVDLGLQASGESTPYLLHPILTPFAAASLVYRGTDPTFARWVDALKGRLDAPGQEDFDKLEAMAAFLRDEPAPMSEGKSARGRRYGRLMQDFDTESDLSRIEKLTRELSLPEDVLPLDVVRAALARGAADEIARWVSEGSAGEFGSVRDRLRKAWAKVDRVLGTWSPEAQRAAEAVSAAVRGRPKESERRAVVAAVDVLEAGLDKSFDDEKKRAGELFEAGRYAEARDAYRAMLVRAGEVIEKAGDVDLSRLPRQVAVCQLNVAACTLNLQDTEEARALLEGIDAKALTPKARLNLAEAWILVGETARAEALLLEASVLEDEALRGRLTEVRQRLSVRRGEMPEELSPSAPLRLDAMTLLLSRNDLAAAGALALEVLNDNKDDTLLMAVASIGLTDALLRTAYENPTDAILLPVGSRPFAVASLEQSFDAVRTAALPESLRRDLERVEPSFRVLTDDLDRLLGLHPLPRAGEQKDELASYEAAFRLARDKRIDEALAALPELRHPWHGRLDRVLLLQDAQAYERALDEARALAKAFPERAPIEYVTAKLCVQERQSEEALPHAELAFVQLPGKGQRLQLAWLRVDRGQAEDGWKLLESYPDDSPATLRMRGYVAAKSGRLEEARSAWDRYIARRPEDMNIRIQYAQLLLRMHRPEEAAAVAWKTFVEQRSRLELDLLYVCGSLQRLAGDLDAEQTRRIEDVAAAIKERYPVEPRADYVRLQLFAMLGRELPAGRAPLDFEKMAEAGLLQARPIADLADFVKQQRTFLAAIEDLARRGAIPVATASALANTPLALLCTRILSRGRHASGLLCPPVVMSDPPKPILLDGATILLSDLELVLLEVLDLSSPLRQALGANGRLVMFRRVHERIQANFAELRADVDSKQLAETEALLRAIEPLPVLEPDPNRPYDDAAAVRRASAAMVVSEPVEGVHCVSPKSFLAYLEQRGCLDEQQRARIEPYFAREAEEGLMSLEPLPPQLVLEGFLVEKLFKEGVLQATFEAFGGVLRCGPGVAPYFRMRRDDMEAARDAARLSDRVHQRLVEGWIQEIAEPAVTDLPPLRAPEEGIEQTLIVKPLQEMLAYRQAALEHPAWWRLTAEFYGSSALGDPHLTGKLAWPSPEAYQVIADRVRKAAVQDLTLPALIWVLVHDEGTRDRCLYKLAELGFPDALGVEEILRLERRFKGLEKAEPKRLLDRQEWMAVEPGHLGGIYARKRLEMIHAGVIFSVFCKPDHKLAAAEAEAVAYTLLARQENIAAKSLGNSLEETLSFIAYRTLEDPLSMGRVENDIFVSDSERSSAATLWKVIAGWAGVEGPRRGSYGRALRNAWLAIAHCQDDGTIVRAAALEMADRLNRDRPGLVSFQAPEREAEAILSARWAEHPLGNRGIAITPTDSKELPIQLSYEEILRRGAEILNPDSAFATDGRVFAYALPVQSGAASVRVLAPVEALLLRAPAVARARLAGHLKGHQGIHDGELYALLERIEAAPEDEDALQAYAHRAVASLFRQVRDDPPFLRVWAQTWMFNKQDDLNGIETLCRILSEPYAPLAKSLHEELRDRLAGIWAQRDEGFELFRMASEVPGALPAAPIPYWLGLPQYDEGVHIALQDLDALDEHPIARIAGDVMFLRVVATRRPLVKLPEGEVDLREILPGRLERLLEKVMAPPMSDTLGAAEAPLLRVCGEVVQRLAAPSELPLREGLWLTYRLFQWLCLQLDAISPDARRSGLQRLVAQVMPPDVPKDVLDPFGFGRDLFDHRLATVLYALSAMEELAQVFAQRAPPDEKLPESRSVSSPALEEKLLMLARRAHIGPSLGSLLEWNAPGNVPDLALNALLRLNQQRFADLGPEARMRRFEALPLDPEALRVSDEAALMFAHRVVLAAVNTAASLTAEEREKLESKVRAMADGPTSKEWRWLVFVSLYAAGVDSLEDEARRATLQHLQHPLAPTALGNLVLGAAARDPARVEPLIEEAIAASSEQGADLIGLVLGALGRLLVNGAPTGQRIAEDLLLRLAKKEDFRKDGRMGEMIGLFGLREREA